MATVLLVKLSYKASHHVSRLDHPVHSNPHYHTWEVVLRVGGQIDAHEVQEWMHHTAPHFGDHGDRGVEDICEWWLTKATERWQKTLKVLGVQVMREDGIGAVAE